MNEKINLTKILKDCPNGTKLYSTIFGDVEFCYIDKSSEFPIKLTAEGGYNYSVSANGRHYIGFDGECTLFPSKDQRDWSKFTAPWYMKDRFNPNTLKPLDNVLVRDYPDKLWKVDFYSHRDVNKTYQYICVGDCYKCCIPYNEETKHLIGTIEEAPDFYKYWED